MEDKVVEILYNIKSWCINLVLSISIWNDIILLILAAVFPKICSIFYHNVRHNRQNKNNKKSVIPWFILFVALCIFFVGYIYIRYAYVKIPDVVGTDHEYAEKQLSDAGLKYNPFYGRDGDVVISISYEEYAKKGTIVELDYGRKTISEDTNNIADDGKDMVSMPDMYLLTEHDAYMYLTARGFSNIEVLTQYRDDIVQGYVIRTEPEASEMLSLEDTITLYVSINQTE